MQIDWPLMLRTRMRRDSVGARGPWRIRRIKQSDWLVIWQLLKSSNLIGRRSRSRVHRQARGGGRDHRGGEPAPDRRRQSYLHGRISGFVVGSTEIQSDL